ncbi:MAG: phosphohistidine phosphatase SixA [Candidatus Palauibacterales bacterium]|nr:phosphohistidine phosphatase SixA [Candidatus Palauibacterales bacterium]MDP2530227.1 phosphohistidine phosphatase SixA [Candidatus Palauibacterales bacterium]MDP2583012.1 phosphohistidine phosphatase SixA [Candidatus Palauibacterales bacterium]
MELYVARHAEAVEESRGGDRPLTEAGRDDARRVGAALAAAGVEVAEVWYSSKLRARETADLLAGAIGGGAHLAERPDLVPLADPTGVLEAVRERESDGPLLLVGHLPHVERLVSLLLTGDEKAEVVEVPTGAVLRLVSADDGRHWRLAWFITPALLRD